MNLGAFASLRPDSGHALRESRVFPIALLPQAGLKFIAAVVGVVPGRAGTSGDQRLTSQFDLEQIVGEGGNP